jgi:tetratricopeptide (TPR) repeat protein
MESDDMSRLPIDQALESYAVKLDQLEAMKGKKGKRITSSQVLEILVERDSVARAIADDGSRMTLIRVQRLLDLDERLRKSAGRIVWVLGERQIERWRSSIHPDEKAWWWWLERVVVDHPLNRLDGVWRLMMVVGWTANITLMVNLAAKFLSGGVGLAGVAAIALPSILGLLQVGSEFTKAGQVGFDRLLGRLRIPSQWREEVKLLLTLMMVGILVWTWLQLPEFSKAQNRSGKAKYAEGKGQIGEAEQDFLKAIALDSDNANAHYNLGDLHDRLEQSDKAKKEYLIAIAGDFPDAYNNLARLYIKEQKYAQAAALLWQGMGLLKERQDRQEKIDPKVQYDLHKNLGWVRLEQKRYDEAEDFLMTAVALGSSPEAVKFVNPSSAHCLLAQVLERQKQPAQEQWRKCQQLGSVTNPDEDSWLYEAQQKLSK